MFGIIVAILNAEVIAVLVVIYKNVVKPIKVMVNFKLFIFMPFVLLLYNSLIELHFKEAFEKNYKEKKLLCSSLKQGPYNGETTKLIVLKRN